MKLQLIKTFLVTAIIVSSSGSAFANDDTAAPNDSQSFMVEVDDHKAQQQADKDAAERRQEIEWKVKEAEYQQRLADLQRENEALSQQQQSTCSITTEYVGHRGPVSSLVQVVAGSAGVAINGQTVNTYPSVVGYPGYAGYGGYAGCNGYVLPCPIGVPYAPYGLRRVFHVSGNALMPYQSSDPD